MNIWIIIMIIVILITVFWFYLMMRHDFIVEFARWRNEDSMKKMFKIAKYNKKASEILNANYCIIVPHPWIPFRSTPFFLVKNPKQYDITYPEIKFKDKNSPVYVYNSYDSAVNGLEYLLGDILEHKKRIDIVYTREEQSKFEKKSQKRSYKKYRVLKYPYFKENEMDTNSDLPF